MAETGSNRPLNTGSEMGIAPYDDIIGQSSFNFGGKPPIEFMQFLLGEEIFTLFGDSMLNEAFESAFKTVSEVIEDSIILENLGNSNSYSETVTATYNAQSFAYEKRILRVLRQNHNDEDTTADTNYYYPCRKITQHKDNAFNPNSIYYENDPFDPVWYITDSGGIKIAPLQTADQPVGKVYYMSFPKFGVGKEEDENITHNLGNTSGWHNFSLISSVDEEEIFHGLPVEARVLVYLEMALSLCLGFISNHVQDDEDIELVSLLNAQVEFLNGKRQGEFQRIVSQFGASKDLGEAK
tara:strand:+ start:141 stop:1028 length:888 start_codon:yes stop_codon:yes gene_type:complete